MRVYRDIFSESKYNDSNSVAAALLQKPAEISSVITHLSGREDKQFPLSFITEGMGQTVTIDGNEYEYRVMDRMDKAVAIAETPSGTNLGIGGGFFKLVFTTNWFNNGYVIAGESGVQVKIFGDPTPLSNGYEYTVKLVSPDPTSYLPATDVIAGKLFGQYYNPVETDFSRGSDSKWMAPSLIRHKLTTLRKSYSFSRAAQNAVMVFEVPTEGGKNTKLWMDWAEYQYMIQYRKECESYYLYGTQSYDETGVTSLQGNNGYPIIVGPGLLDQIQNRTTYSDFTVELLDSILGSLYIGMSDAQEMDITVYTGIGGFRVFDRALKDKLGNMGFNLLVNSDKFVEGSGYELALQGYFRTYKHVDGHTLRLVKHPMYDFGPRAQVGPWIDALPLESYRMTFVDQSKYDGQSNILMVNQRGGEMLRWGVAGSTVPNGMGNSNLLRASDIDGASVHFLKTAGIVLRRFTTSFDLQRIKSV